jgi:hypothetical protein
MQGIFTLQEVILKKIITGGKTKLSYFEGGKDLFTLMWNFFTQTHPFYRKFAAFWLARDNNFWLHGGQSFFTDDMFAM